MFSVAAFRSTLSHWPTEYDGENDESASGCRIFSKRGQIPDMEVDSIDLIQLTKTELPLDPDRFSLTGVSVTFYLPPY